MISSAGPLLLALVQGVAGSAPADATAPETPAAERSNAIAVIVPAGDNPSMVDALTRLRGEAASVGFEIRLVDARTNLATAEQLQQVASELQPAAVVALEWPLVGAGGTAAPKEFDVWFLDRATGKTSVGHLFVDEKAGDRADLLLAVRAVDFIRARMFDSLVWHQTQRRAPIRSHPTVGRGYVAAGVAATGSFAGLPRALLPFAEIGFTPWPWLRLSLSGAGFGSQPRKEIVEGSAVVDESFGALSLALLSPVWWRFLLFAQVGGALAYVHVHGEGSSGYIGRDRSMWTSGGLGAVGVEVVLASHVVFHLTGGGLVLLREPKVVIADVEVARTGRPAWLLSSTLGVTF